MTEDLPNNETLNTTIIKCESEESIDSEISEKGNNFDEVLSDLKLSGKYHLKFFLLITFLIINDAGFAINYIFSAEDVHYQCKYSNCTSIVPTMINNTTVDYGCLKYELLKDDETCTEDNFDVNNFTECSEWIYEEPNSFVAEFNLGCADWKRTLVGTIHSIGYMIGLPLGGLLSDNFGRKKILILSALYAGAIGIIKSMVTSYWIFIAFEALEPIFATSYTTIYTLVIEMMTTKNRPIVTLLFATSGALGYMRAALIAYLTPTWRIYLISLYSPAFIFLSYMFYLDESPRWLLIKGRKEKAEHIIKKAAKINNIIVDKSKIENMTCSEESSNMSIRVAIYVTFSSRKLLIRLLLCTCIWFTMLFNSYSLLINAVSLEGNKYLNFVFVNLSYIAGGFITTFVLSQFKRKRPLIIALILTGVSCVSQSLVPKGYKWLSIFLYACGKISESIVNETTFLYTTELFPTYTRNTMLALCSSIGRVGAVIAPLTPLLTIYWSGLPLCLVGVLSMITASIVTLIPDTSEDALPDNVKQAENLGMKVKKTDFPPNITTANSESRRD